jgi:hypothetical protein
MRAEGRLKETEINKRPILRWGRKKKAKELSWTESSSIPSEFREGARWKMGTTIHEYLIYSLHF